MPPNSKETEVFPGALKEDELEKLVAPQADPQWRWQYDPKRLHMITSMLFIHLAGLYGLKFVLSAKWTTLVFLLIYYTMGVLGVTMGAHRLWAHKAYKATLPLQIILMLCHSCAHQRSIMWWSETHRQHHKYSDTDADPHNATRGFFFAHIGWFMVKKHPEVVKRRPFVDVSDLRSDPVLKFQKKFLSPCLNTMGVIIPTMVMWWLGETFSAAWHLNMLRLVISYNNIFAINSVAHFIGNKPYDKSIAATQNLPLSLVALGEGFHNYHHTFPWDYRVAELGNNYLNLSTIMIDLCAKLGWAYDLKAVRQELIDTRAARTGDGTDSWGNQLRDKSE